jgi:hypothetical protein
MLRTCHGRTVAQRLSADTNAPTPMIVSSTPSSATARPRSARRFGRAAALTTVTLAATLTSVASIALTEASPVAASPAIAPEMATNALADQITMAAAEAVTSLEAYDQSGNPADAQDLAWHRAIAARYTAQQLGYDELQMVTAWSDAPLGHQRALLGALTQIGVPYRTNTSKPGIGFDCSGLTTYAWAGAGVELYRQSGSQINEAAPLTREHAKAGDLVHYPGHIMMYLGVGDAIIHSITHGRTVEVDTISERRRNTVRWGDPTA